MSAYYNEIDPAACAVLRELISRDVIAPGDVDGRSIKEISPDDVRGYTQVHFFAGGGIWSFAARLAGWPDDRPLWTGSCPCQPFSGAGKGGGTDDARHLWPDFHRLIGAGRPPVVMGEQVAGAAGYSWFDGVRADLAGEAYTSRAVDIPACAVDAPQQRNRLYWIAELQSDADRGGRDGRTEEPQWQQEQRASAERASDGVFAHAGSRSLRDEGCCAPIEPASSVSGEVRQQRVRSDNRPIYAHPRNGSWWADAEWIVSPIDDKARRTKPGLPFLVDGVVGRTDLWRLCGNSIVPVLAAEVIAAFLDAEVDPRAMT